MLVYMYTLPESCTFCISHGEMLCKQVRTGCMPALTLLDQGSWASALQSPGWSLGAPFVASDNRTQRHIFLPYFDLSSWIMSLTRCNVLLHAVSIAPKLGCSKRHNHGKCEGRLEGALDMRLQIVLQTTKTVCCPEACTLHGLALSKVLT